MKNGQGMDLIISKWFRWELSKSLLSKWKCKMTLMLNMPKIQKGEGKKFW